jgi:hypothetical protein
MSHCFTFSELAPVRIESVVDPIDFRAGEVAGVEPAGVGESTPVNKRGEELSPEALTHMLTNLADVDRRMLSQIVERWGDLSDELKRAVLAVVGSG